jgi:TRAP-type C4-dicarboxylate transport system substrate-binding protein
MKPITKRLARAALVVLVATWGSSAYAQKTLTMATGDAVGSLRNQLGNWVKDRLEKNGGPLRVKHIEGPVLGNAAQITDQVISGTLDIAGFDAAWLTPYSDLLKTTSFAFVFRDQDHLQRVLTSDLMRDIVENVAKEHGIRILGLRALPARTFFSKNALSSAADLQGLKIRSPQLNVWIESYKALGANPTPVNWNEVFLALKTGLVDAGHGLPADVIANKWHLAAPNITGLEDGFGVHAWFINEKKWQGLTDAEKKELQRVMDESMAWLAQRSDELNFKAVVDMVKEGGGTYTSHSAANRDRMAKEVGAERVKVFPEAEYQKLRSGALEAARKLEGSKDWWSKGTVEKIEAIR